MTVPNREPVNLIGQLIGDSNILTAAIITAAVLAITAIFFFVYRTFGPKPNAILLVGLSDAGKTTIFTKLINSKNAWKTYMSMTENRFSQFLTQNGTNCTLVDVPGAESIRRNLLAKWLTEDRKLIKCIVFVVDSSTFAQKCKDAAELLYDVVFESNRSIPILVACNKQDDQLKAKTAKGISADMEKEFGLINVSRAAALSSTSGETTPRVLTSTGADFQWAELNKRNGRPLVSFAECSAEMEGKLADASSAKLSLDSIRLWIDSL